MASTGPRSTVILRSIVSLVAGLAAAVAVAPALGIAAGLLAGWSTLCLVSVVWITIIVWPMSGADTKHHASAEDPGRPAARLVALIGSTASLAAVFVVLYQTGIESEMESYVLAAIAFVSVASSWGLIQVDYALRTARIYYADPVGGIDFNDGAADPSYSDFYYFSLGVGMGYQVADTNVKSNQIRRTVTAQALIAYLFGAVIIGTVVNLVLDLG
ncbi:MAG: DUF1345 domain-containing protein [Microbacterium sp.]